MYASFWILVPAAFLALLVCLPFWLLSKRRNGALAPIRALAFMGLAGTVIMILYATIFWMLPLHFSSYHLLNLKPFVWVHQTYAMGFFPMLEQLFLNICMFVPLGCLLPVVFCAMRRWYCTVLTACFFSFLIEFVQYFIGRSADVDDLIMNTLGAAVGYFIFWLLNLLFASFLWWKKALGQSGHA